jgi:hypothetical protein
MKTGSENQCSLSEITFSNNQMVNTRSGGGQDVPPVIRAHIANQHNPAAPPPQGLAMDPTMQQFFTAQMQLIQDLTTTVGICRHSKTSRHHKDLYHLHHQSTNIESL